MKFELESALRRAIATSLNFRLTDEERKKRKKARSALGHDILEMERMQKRFRKEKKIADFLCEVWLDGQIREVLRRVKDIEIFRGRFPEEGGICSIRITWLLYQPFVIWKKTGKTTKSSFSTEQGFGFGLPDIVLDRFLDEIESGGIGRRIEKHLELIGFFEYS